MYTYGSILHNSELLQNMISITIDDRDCLLFTSYFSSPFLLGKARVSGKARKENFLGRRFKFMLQKMIYIKKRKVCVVAISK